MSHHEEGAEGQVEKTASAAEQTEGPAVGAAHEPVATHGEPVATHDEADATHDEADDGGGKGKAAAVAAGTGAAVAGIAGGIAVAARDTRRRVLGVPIGKRGRFQRVASEVVDKAQEPVRKLGSRFSRD
jgi:hypothetical protein